MRHWACRHLWSRLAMHQFGPTTDGSATPLYNTQKQELLARLLRTLKKTAQLVVESPMGTQCP
jgi:hypothetical protein